MKDTTHCSVCGQEFGASSYRDNIYDIYEVYTDPDLAQEKADEEILVLCRSCFVAAMAVLKIFYPKKAVRIQK